MQAYIFDKDGLRVPRNIAAAILDNISVRTLNVRISKWRKLNGGEFAVPLEALHVMRPLFIMVIDDRLNPVSTEQFSLTIRQMCELCQMTRPTFYRRFAAFRQSNPAYNPETDPLPIVAFLKHARVHAPKRGRPFKTYHHKR